LPEIHLRAEIDYAKLQFFASQDGCHWQPIGPTLDASKLSDDYHQGLHFTGAFVGLAAHDVPGSALMPTLTIYTQGDCLISPIGRSYKLLNS